MDEPGILHLSQMNDAEITNNNMSTSSTIFCEAPRRATSALFLPKKHNLNLILRKLQTNLNWGTATKHLISTLQTCEGAKVRKDKVCKTITDKKILKRHGNPMQCGILDWILEQKEKISGKTDKNLNEVYNSVISIVPMKMSQFCLF